MNAKIENILSEVRTGVQEMMEQTIIGGDNRFHYEKEYGTAYIDIDFHEVYCGAFMIDDFDIHVSHEDACKESPMLESALRAVMPDWFKIKEELMPTA